MHLYLALSALLFGSFACVDLPQLTSNERDGAIDSAHETADVGKLPSLRIGGWNVRKLGFEANKELAAIASIIESRFDLVALQEVMWTSDGASLRTLTDLLGPGWAMQVTSSARPNLPSPHAEYYAVAYRLQLVAPCAEYPELRHVPDNDGSGETGPDLFLREPAVGCYRVVEQLGGMDFLLASYHARWGDGSPQHITQEVQNVDSVLDTMRAIAPSERQLFLIGDLNLSTRALSGLSTGHDRTRGTGSTLTSSGAISDNLYDHLLAWGDEANGALVGDAVVIDVRDEANAPDQFRARISDHLPIVARLHLSPDDD